MIEIINRVGAIVGLLALLTGAIVYIYGTGKQKRQDILRQDNDDLTKSNTLLRSEKLANDATIEAQQAALKNLRDIATQTPAVERLIELITKQQTVASEQHTKVIQELSSLTGKISELAKAINKSRSGGKS